MSEQMKSTEPIAPRDAEALDITESVEVELDVLVELGETVEVVLSGGNRIEAFLTDNVFVLDPRSPEARTALRSYAYGLASRGKTEEAKRIMRAIGRQG